MKLVEAELYAKGTALCEPQAWPLRLGPGQATGKPLLPEGLSVGADITVHGGTIFDVFARYIVARTLCITMPARDLTDTPALARRAAGLEQATVASKTRLLPDNGSSFISGDLAGWLDDRDIRHVRDAPYHPTTQGRTGCWHQALKNRNLQENDDLPGDLEAQIEAVVDHFNRRRYHESQGNLAPADPSIGRDRNHFL